MKNKFSEYYAPSDDDFKKLWKESHFVFDANSLLNLYMYTEETVNDFLKVFENIEDRIWLSFQAGYEFHKNRADRIRTQQILFEKTTNSIKDISATAKSALEQNFKNTREHPSIQENEIINQVSGFFKSLIKNIEDKKKKYPDLLVKEDYILNKVTDLFSEKVGNEFSEKELEELAKEGEKRYEREIPPGFEDSKVKKGMNKFGDLIIWKEIIRFAKNDNVKSIIFITDDAKKDWWKIASGRTIGPHPSLIKEFKDETSKDYYQYNSAQFLKFAKSNLVDVSDKSISEIKRIAKLNSPSVKVLKILNDRYKKINETKLGELSQNQIDEMAGRSNRAGRLAELLRLNEQDYTNDISQELVDRSSRIKALADILLVNNSNINTPDDINAGMTINDTDEETS